MRLFAFVRSVLVRRGRQTHRVAHDMLKRYHIAEYVVVCCKMVVMLYVPYHKSVGVPSLSA